MEEESKRREAIYGGVAVSVVFFLTMVRWLTWPVWEGKPRPEEGSKPSLPPTPTLITTPEEATLEPTSFPHKNFSRDNFPPYPTWGKKNP
jgi:hypothetical protein